MTHTHTHQLHNFNCRGINLCNARVSLVSACLASMISQKGNYTTIMLVELMSNCTHTSYTSTIVGELIALRAKGTLISEPRFSTPCEMRFFPREKGKTAFLGGKSLDNGRFPFLAWENRISQGVENRGSLISVPLALRVCNHSRSHGNLRPDGSPKLDWARLNQATLSRSLFHPQPPSLLILLSQPGSERKVLTKETWFSLLREWKLWKLQWEQFLPRPGSP